jgi:hypothetical protein
MAVSVNSDHRCSCSGVNHQYGNRGGNGIRFERAQRIYVARTFISSRLTRRLRSQQQLQRLHDSSRFDHNTVVTSGLADTRTDTRARADTRTSTDSGARARTDTRARTGTRAGTGTAAGRDTGLSIQQWRRLPRRADAFR